MANITAAIENYSFLDDDHLNVDEFSNIDSTLLMSLLDEGGDDHIQVMSLRSSMINDSLEPAEIMNQDYSCSETDDNSDAASSDYHDDFRFSQVDDHLQLESCSSTSPDHHPDFDQWMDMDMAYSCPGYEMNGYFIGRFTENMVDLGGLEDYSQASYEDMPMEEDDYIGLWQ